MCKIVRYCFLFCLLSILVLSCRRSNNLKVEDYKKEFPWNGIDKQKNSYEELNIRFCDPYIDEQKFRSPMVLLDNPHTYKVTLKFKFKCSDYDITGGGQGINYKIRFIDSCGNLRTIKPANDFCTSGKNGNKHSTAHTQSGALRLSPRNWVSYAVYSSQEEEGEEEEGEEEGEEEEDEESSDQHQSSTNTQEENNRKNQTLKEKLQKCKESEYSSDDDYHYNPNVDSIVFKVRSGYPMYLSVSGSGPRESGVQASIHAEAEDGFIGVPTIATDQTQNRDGSAQLQEPLCQYIILP